MKLQFSPNIHKFTIAFFQLASTIIPYVIIRRWSLFSIKISLCCVVGVLSNNNLPLLFQYKTIVKLEGELKAHISCSGAWVINATFKGKSKTVKRLDLPSIEITEDKVFACLFVSLCCSWPLIIVFHILYCCFFCCCNSVLMYVYMYVCVPLCMHKVRQAVLVVCTFDFKLQLYLHTIRSKIWKKLECLRLRL